MTKRYGIATPEDLERQERERRRKEAEYQALLMPEPGTAAWDKGLETSTPFFDILTGGIGIGLRGGAARLTREIIARQKGGLLGKTKGSGVLDTKAEELARKYQKQGNVLTAETLRAIPGKKLKYVDRPGGERPSGYSATKPTPDFDLTRSPYNIPFDEFHALSPALQARLLRHHKIDPEDLLGYQYKSGGLREKLVNAYEYSKMKGLTERAREFKSQIDDYDRRFGLNIEYFRHPDESPFWWDM